MFKRILCVFLAALLLPTALISCTKPSVGPEQTETTDGVTAKPPVISKPKNEVTVSFLGDSITFGFGLENQEDCYTTLICKERGMKENNCGICGTLVAKAGQNRDDNLDFITRLDVVGNPDILVIFGGTNDYFWSDKPIYPPEDEEDPTIEYFSVAIDYLCRYVCENGNPEATVFVTPYPHKGVGNYAAGKFYRQANEHETHKKNFVGHVLEDYCDCIVEICGKYGIPVLNLHEIEGFDYKTMTSDGCHPNPEGHKWLANIIGSRIDQMFE